MQIPICINSPNQKAGWPSPEVPSAKLGNTVPGPVLSGAVSRARIVATDPSTCAAVRVNVIWNLVMVWRRIIPNPTPCRASRTPNHSHKHLPSSADVNALPAHGRYCPMADVPQSIWHQRGAPRPMAKTGRIQECDFESLAKIPRNIAHMITKKAMTSNAIAQAGACCVVQRYLQFLPYGAESQ